ncbi:FecR domain-containing protein (plasmid) [Ensifer adhaerens]|uniref:FecR domain-containing protein n=1 Tax=Ensifer adhaerens TaxID=106592 RepID=UPI0023A9CB97|nr:FecR domain-containing protein [Ensifer adhaerens]WDZ81728.1 FecR domain-containing protein [Ensifer adhaerens]
MFCLRGAALIALCAVTFSPTIAAEPVGQAVEIRTAVSGARGAIAVKDPIYRDERISTSKSGLGQFVFQDGTKLAVGWGSSVVIDKFVYDDAKSVKKLTIMAAKGTFRWISGKSGHSAYQIVTPAGTIGVRGTAFDFYVGRDGTTAVVLLSGAASFCGAGGCRQLTQRCDCVVAKPGGGITDPRRVSRNTLKSLGNAKALPFLSGGQRLSGALGWAGGGCSLAAAINEDIEPKPKTVRPPAVEQERPRQDPQQPEEKPDKPNKPDKKPEKPAEEEGYRNRHWETKHPDIRGEDANHKDVLEHANDHQNRGNKGHKHHDD